LASKEHLLERWPPPARQRSNEHLAYRLATKLPQPDETLTIDSHFAQEESPTRAQNVYRW
jgi:hypothetical protein